MLSLAPRSAFCCSGTPPLPGLKWALPRRAELVTAFASSASCHRRCVCPPQVATAAASTQSTLDTPRSVGMAAAQQQPQEPDCSADTFQQLLGIDIDDAKRLSDYSQSQGMKTARDVIRFLRCDAAPGVLETKAGFNTMPAHNVCQAALEVSAGMMQLCAAIIHNLQGSPVGAPHVVQWVGGGVLPCSGVLWCDPAWGVKKLPCLLAGMGEASSAQHVHAKAHAVGWVFWGGGALLRLLQRFQRGACLCHTPLDTGMHARGTCPVVQAAMQPHALALAAGPGAGWVQAAPHARRKCSHTHTPQPCCVEVRALCRSLQNTALMCQAGPAAVALRGRAPAVRQVRCTQGARSAPLPRHTGVLGCGTVCIAKQ